MRLLLHGRLPASMILKRLKETTSSSQSSSISSLVLSGWTFSKENDVEQQDHTDHHEEKGTLELQQTIMNFICDHPGMDEITLQNCRGSRLKRLMFAIQQASPKTLTIRYDKQQKMPSGIAHGFVQGNVTRIERINLRGITLTPTAMEALQLSLPEHFPCLQALSIKGNLLLKEVNLGISIFGDKDASSSSYFDIEDTTNLFSSLLLELPTLKCLELECCHLEDSQLAVLLHSALSSSNLQTLKLKGNQSQEHNLRVLAKYLASQHCALETLDLTWQHVPSDESSNNNNKRTSASWQGVPLLVSGLAKNSSLRTLILSENRLHTMDVDLLARALDSSTNNNNNNTTLERLELKNCRLSATSLRCLARRLPNMHLKYLHIDGTQMIPHQHEKKMLKDMFLVPLTNNTHLQDLAMNCESQSIEQLLKLNRDGQQQQQQQRHTKKPSMIQHIRRKHLRPSIAA